jgi:hypothetical protein
MGTPKKNGNIFRHAKASWNNPLATWKGGKFDWFILALHTKHQTSILSRFLQNKWSDVRMNVSKKGIIVLALVFTILIGSVAYAIFHASYTIPNNSVSIAGIGLEVHNWAEGETVGILTTTINFGLLTPPEKGYSQNIVFVADCNGVNENITWTTNLSSTIGTISLQQEVYNYASSTWNWQPLASGFILTDHQTIGLRPAAGLLGEGSKGHIQIVLQTLETATHGDFTFTITFNADQV